MDFGRDLGGFGEDLGRIWAGLRFPIVFLEGVVGQRLRKMIGNLVLPAQVMAVTLEAH